MEADGFREVTAWRGRGAVSAFTVRYDRWRVSALLEADEFDEEGPRLLEHARAGLMGTLGAAWSDSIDPPHFLQKVLDQANRETWYRIRTNPVWADRFVGVLIAITDGVDVWVGQAGHGRVFGGDIQGFRELMRPQTAASRMIDDGTLPSWDESPENLRRKPLQGLGLPALDFSSRIKGPIPRAASGTLLLASFEVGELTHPSELGSFLCGEEGEEAGLGRLLDYCRSRDASADVGAVFMVWGSSRGVADGAEVSSGAEALPEGEDAWQAMDQRSRGEGVFLRNLVVFLLVAAAVAAGLWWFIEMGRSGTAGGEAPESPPPLESLYRGGGARPDSAPAKEDALPDEALPPLPSLDEVDPAPVHIPITHKITPVIPDPSQEPANEALADPSREPAPEPLPDPSREPATVDAVPKPKPKPKPKPSRDQAEGAGVEPPSEPEREEIGAEAPPTEEIGAKAPPTEEIGAEAPPTAEEPSTFGASPPAEFVPRIKLPAREKAMDKAPDEEEPEFGPDGVMVMDFTDDDEPVPEPKTEKETGDGDETDPDDPDPATDGL